MGSLALGCYVCGFLKRCKPQQKFNDLAFTNLWQVDETVIHMPKRFIFFVVSHNGECPFCSVPVNFCLVTSPRWHGKRGMKTKSFQMTKSNQSICLVRDFWESYDIFIDWLNFVVWYIFVFSSCPPVTSGHLVKNKCGHEQRSKSLSTIEISKHPEVISCVFGQAFWSPSPWPWPWQEKTQKSKYRKER